MRSLWFSVLVCAAMFVACGDDESDFAARPSDGSSSSVCEDCDDGSSSSSSSVKSSSSVTLASPCKTKTEDDCEYGSLTDDRDGQTYKTVKIGDQVWMAENLNYAYTGVPYNYDNDASDSISWCYGNDPAKCTKYGRLYTLAAAMDSAGTWTTNGKGCGNNKTCSPTYPVRGVCPDGWHLPTYAEWYTLINAVGGSSVVGKLKSTSGWKNSGNGTDDFGFSAFPAGYGYDGGNYGDEGDKALFWHSLASDCRCAIFLHSGNSIGEQYYNSSNQGFSVRCLKDDP